MLLTPEQLAVASPEELTTYAESLKLATALQSPLDYAEFVSEGVERFPHTELLSSLIVRAMTGRLLHPATGKVVRKLAISMPPRYGKSYVISDHTPAWSATRWADYGFRVGLASYEADFAADWGEKARTHVQDHPEFGVQVNPNSRARDKWNLLPMRPGASPAGMHTAGVGGPFTGRGFHLVIIDDPIKNAETAMSQTLRDKAWNWLGSTAMTRLAPLIKTTDPLTGEQVDVGRTVILVNTRWHEDDVMGRLLKEEPNAWYHLNLKGIADADAPASDPIGRQPGEVLCPQLFTAEEVEDVRASPVTGGRWFAAMYQGEPNIEGGGIFKRSSFRYHRAAAGGHEATSICLRDPSGAEEYVPREKLSRFSTLDTAATVRTQSDFSVLATWDVTPDRKLLLVDRVRQKLESADLTDWVHAHFERLKPSYIGIGAKTYGLSVITELGRRGVPVRPLAENDDKISRAMTAGSLIDHGRVFFPEGVPWLLEWEAELLAFPNTRHDDQVDVLSLAAREVALGPWAVPAREKQYDDQSLEARIARHLDNKRRRRGSRRHPDLGRL